MIAEINLRFSLFRMCVQEDGMAIWIGACNFWCMVLYDTYDSSVFMLFTYVVTYLSL